MVGPTVSSRGRAPTVRLSASHPPRGVSTASMSPPPPDLPELIPLHPRAAAILIELRSQSGPERTQEWEVRRAQEAVEIPEFSSSSSSGGSSSGRSTSSCSSHHEHADQHSVDTLIRQAESLGVQVEPFRPDGADRAALHLAYNLVETGFCLLPPAGYRATQGVEPECNFPEDVSQEGDDRAWAKRLLAKRKQAQSNSTSVTPGDSARCHPAGPNNRVLSGWAARLKEKKGDR